MTATLAPVVQAEPPEAQQYDPRMAVSAAEIAAALREEILGLSTRKLHKLLYYCQGHHLATFGTRLFAETISAADRGPIVGALWVQERQGLPPVPHDDLTNAELNTVGYVVSRYGGLTDHDLELLTRSETPYRLADRDRRARESTRIELDWMTEYFRSDGAEGDGDDTVQPDSAEIRRWLAMVATAPQPPDRADSLDEIRARLADYA